MSKIDLKTDFTDGQKLFGQELNNNFSTIEAAFEGTTKKYEKIVEDVIDRRWQSDEEEPTVNFFRGNTTEINSKEKKDGQLLYNTTTGETFLDNDNRRILTGGGTVVAIQETEPTNPATKIWVNPNDINRTAASNVIDSMEGDSHLLAPSVHSVKDYYKNPIITLYNTDNNIQLQVGNFGTATIPFNAFYEANQNRNKLIPNLSGNEIRIGAGVSKVKISGGTRVATSSVGTTTSVEYQIYKSGATQAIGSAYFVNNYYASPTVADRVIEVSQGDVIKAALFVNLETTSTYTIAWPSKSTYLTVEVVE